MLLIFLTNDFNRELFNGKLKDQTSTKKKKNSKFRFHNNLDSNLNQLLNKIDSIFILKGSFKNFKK